MTRKIIFSLLMLSVLTGCAAAKPPSCDGSNKRPINSDKESHETPKEFVVPDTFSS